MLLVGDPGSGKTLTSSTFPGVYIASAEGGLMSIHEKNLPHAEITTSEDLFELKNILTKSSDVRKSELGVDPQTVVIDTIDEVQGILIRERIESEKLSAMRIQDFGWLNEQMQSIIRGFRNLDLNVVFTCHVKETRDDELGRIVYKPGLQGAIGDKIAGFVDISGILQGKTLTKIVGNETKQIIQRTFKTFPDPQYPWLKDRSGKLPGDFSINFVDDYARMHKLIYGDSPIVDNPALSPIEVIGVIGEPEKVEPEVKEPEPEEVEQATDGKYECYNCGANFDDEDQAELSKIRLRKLACATCYAELKRKK